MRRQSLAILTLSASVVLFAGCVSGSMDDGANLEGDETGGDDATPPPSGGDGIQTDAGKAGPGGSAGDGIVHVGAGGSAFDAKDDGSSGVKVDPTGSIAIDPAAWGGSTQPVIWVANSDEGTVSKIDTRTMKELARYRTAPDSPASDPSRTTVNLNGDVVVVNRKGASATKIASSPVDCTGPGTGTSSGGTDVRAWGDDKCVLWNTPFEAGSLGRAGAFDAEKGVDGDLSTSVWVGQWTLSRMIQLDSKTGKLLATVDVSPIKPYGAAVDKDHHIWVWGGGVGYIDAATRKWTQIETPPCAYGIAVDPKGRVWTSGGGCVARYTPSAGKWESLKVGTSNRGLAVDAKGSVWVADTAFGVHHLDEEKLTLIADLPLATGGEDQFVGMAIDFDGMVWTVNRGKSHATKIDPKTYATTTVPVGTGPYTYSDMTGFQLRNAADPFGKYRHVFVGCGEATKWSALDWKASVPDGTTITVRARSSKDLVALKTTPWTIVAKMPPDKPPVDLGTKLGGGTKGNYLEVEFELESVSATVTPILSSIGVSSACPAGTK